MKNADMALYAAKAAGKNRLNYFHAAMSEQANALMVSTCKPRMARACSSNSGKTLRAKGYQTVNRAAADVGEVHLVAAHQQLDAEHTAAAER